jgi:integrase
VPVTQQCAKRAVRTTFGQLARRIQCRDFHEVNPLDKFVTDAFASAYTSPEEQCSITRWNAKPSSRLHSRAFDKTLLAIKPTPVTPLDDDQVGRLLEALEGDRLAALFVLALDTGMRQGELFALRWADVDLSKGNLYVQRAASETADGITSSQGNRDA